MGRVFICTDLGPLVVEGKDCPNVDQHQPCPVGYTAWHGWAETAAKVATQEAPCPGCDLWRIWTPRWPDVRVAMVWPVPACGWESCKSNGVGERLAGGAWVPVCARHAKAVS